MTRTPIVPIATVIAAVRLLGFHIFHTREGHRADLSDLPENKRWRSRRIGAGIGDPNPCGRILVRGEPGWELIPELAPRAGEPVIDKPGAFYSTDFELVLRLRGIANLVLARRPLWLSHDRRPPQTYHSHGHYRAEEQRERGPTVSTV